MSNKNVERGRATRVHLVDVATRLFAAHGYGGTSIEMVLAESGASRGSLYHHFAGKDALFWAVLGSVGVRAGARLAESTRDTHDPIAKLRVSCLGWIQLACDPVVRQILLIDAPAVLGWQRWRELDEQGNLHLIKDALARAAAAGRLEPRHVDVYAHIVLAAANEVTMMIARADDPAAAFDTEQDAFTEFLDRLLSDPANPIGAKTGPPLGDNGELASPAE